MSSFDLIDEPWIPCLLQDGSNELLSLRTVFSQGHEVRDLATTVPSERVALLRFLIAVHQAALRGPASSEEVFELLDARRFNDRVGEYLTSWRARFDLFDSERPFMQARARHDVGATTIATLLPEWSSGNNTTLVDHHRDDEPPALSPAEAARAVLVAQAYQLGGGVSKPFNRTAAPLAGGLVALLVGATLFDTIVINGPPYSPDDGVSGKSDLPAWERDEERIPRKEGTVPDGWLDLLTWCPRAIRLVRDDDGAVRRCVIHQHLRLPDGTQDPHVPVQLGRGGALVRVKARAGRALWRQADGILIGLGATAFERSTSAFVALPDLLDDDRVRGIEVAGVVGSQGKIDDWAYARFPIGKRLAQDVEALGWVRRALERAEAVARRVRYALRDEDAKRHVSVGWEPSYWAVLGARFDALLRDAVAGAAIDVLDRSWDESLRAAAHTALDQVLSTHIESPAGFEREAIARRKLVGGLAQLLFKTPVEEAA